MHFFPPQKSAKVPKTNHIFRVSENLYERKFWRKNQTSRFRVCKRHILHSIPRTMFALSAQSFAVSARCVRLISHPISSRRCPIFFSFDCDPSKGALSRFSLSQNFFERRGAKNKAKSRERRLFFAKLISKIFCRLEKIEISFRKTHRNPLLPRRNTVVNRKQTSKRASLKVRAEVRPVF